MEGYSEQPLDLKMCFCMMMRIIYREDAYSSGWRQGYLEAKYLSGFHKMNGSGPGRVAITGMQRVRIIERVRIEEQ